MSQSPTCSTISMHVECTECCIALFLNGDGFLCALETFLPPLMRCLAKLFHQLFARPSLSPPCLHSLIAQHIEISLSCMRTGETHKEVQILRWTETRQLSKRSLESILAAALSSGFLVGWSYFRPPNSYTRPPSFVDRHSTRSSVLHSRCSSSVVQGRQQINQLLALGSRQYSWYAESGVWSCLQAAAELSSSVGEQRKGGRWSWCDEDSRPWAHRPGRCTPENDKVSKRKFKLCWENANASFFVKSSEIKMRDCQLCKVHSSKGNKSYGSSFWKYRRSKSAPAWHFWTPLYRTQVGRVLKTKPKMPIQFCSELKANWILRFGFVFRVQLRGK